MPYNPHYNIPGGSPAAARGHQPRIREMLDRIAEAGPIDGGLLELHGATVAERIDDGEGHYPVIFADRNAGLEGNMGLSAYIRQGGIHVLPVSRREQPYDTAFARTLDLDPRQMRYIGVKSMVHFRAGFESWAGAIYAVSEPGVHDPVTGNLQFYRLGRKVYPLDEI